MERPDGRRAPIQASETSLEYPRLGDGIHVASNVGCRAAIVVDYRRSDPDMLWVMVLHPRLPPYIAETRVWHWPSECEDGR